MGNIIEVKDVWFNYSDGTAALSGVNLNLPHKSKTVLLGENGAGKSTLLLHLNALHLPLRGEVLYNGHKVTADNEDFVRSKVGLVFQDPDDQIFAPSVFEDVVFGPLNMGLHQEAAFERAEHALEIVGLAHLKHKAPHHLSYGQKKRVAIAGVLAMEPEVIVLDEPAAYLDPAGQDLLWKVLTELNQTGKTILIATHDVNMAGEWADHVVILNEGKTLAQGSADILVNKKLVDEAHLHLPIVARLYLELNPNAKELPYNIKQAMQLIKLKGGL